MTNLTDWLTQARDRADAATAGPWQHTGRNAVHTQRGACVALSHRSNDQQRWGDAEFIAAARTDLPAALDAIQAVLDLIRSGGEFPTTVADGEHIPRHLIEHRIATALGASEP